MRMTWYTREINNNLFVDQFRPSLHPARRSTLPEALNGNAIASFLLGAPASGAIANNFYPTLRWNYNAPWVQDDWRLTDKLTLNLGFRWDFNTPVFEEDNRLNYVFDTTSTNPVNGRINTALLPNGGPLRGGPTFVEVNGNPKYPYQYDKNNIQPRVGFAYQLNDKTVVRGGYGLYYINVVDIGSSDGFAIETPLITSLDGDRNSTLPVLQSVLAGHPAGARIVARTGNASRPRPVFREHRLRESLRAPVLAGLPATVAVADDRGARLRRQPHARRAEPLGGIQHATRGAPRSVRSDQGRFGGVLQRAAAESVLRGRRIRGDESVHESDAVPVRVEPAISAVHADHRARSERRAESGTTPRS